MAESFVSLFNIFINLPSKEILILVLLIITSFASIIVFGFKAGKMSTQYRVEKIDSEKARVLHKNDLLISQNNLLEEKLRIVLENNKTINETPSQVTPESQIVSGTSSPTKKTEKVKVKEITNQTNKSFDSIINNRLITNENKIIFVGYPNPEDIDKLTLKGITKIGGIDGSHGRLLILSKRKSDIDKLKSIIKDKSKSDIFHKQVYSKHMENNEFNFLSVVNFIEEILE